MVLSIRATLGARQLARSPNNPASGTSCARKRTLCNKVRFRMTAAELVRVRKVVQCVCLSFRELGVNDLTWDLISKAADGSVVVRCCLRLMHMRVAIVGCIKLQTFVKSATRLGRSLHDLVILSLAGFPKSGCLLLRDYWDQISLETISSDLPIEGILTWPEFA